MEQYIDKDAIAAEINRRLEVLSKDRDFNYLQIKELKALLSSLDALEVKEVDLEKEIELVKGDYEQVDVAWNNDFDFIANHFFELGLKAQKG